MSKVQMDERRILAVLEGLDYRDGVYSASDIRKARDRVRRRVQSTWSGSVALPARRLKRIEPTGNRRGVPVLAIDPVEILIMRELAATSPSRQFGVTPHGVVFTASTNGKSREDQRLYLEGLSRALDSVVDLFMQLRLGEGGRFYEHEGAIVYPAARRRVLMILEPDR